MLRLILSIILLLFSSHLHAEPKQGLLNKLLAPGPLIEGHKELEQKDCLLCHELNKGIPNSKCLDCHKDIATNVTMKKGFHGLNTKNCIACHSDHKGRGFDSTKIVQSSFDHSQTGYPLVGKHKDLSCKECHREQRTKRANRKTDPIYLGIASTTCVSCHKKDDPHFFKGKYAQSDCNSCHSASAWKLSIKFNHDKDTTYPLEGKHKDLKCVDCHKKGSESIYQFNNLKTAQCLTCHKDQHRGNLGEKFAGGDCKKCHTINSWKIQKFNHTITGYELKGKHADLKCAECHKQTKTLPLKDFHFSGLKKDCLSCHKNEHLFKQTKSRKIGNLNNCLTCHNEKSWKQSFFNHNKDTHFEIGGKHIGVKCNDCHKLDKKEVPALRIFQWPNLKEKTCETCHASPHLKTFSAENLAKRCTQCHVDTSWQTFKDKNFDHNSATRFALEGRHSEISCSSCHVKNKKQVFKFTNVESKFCIDCHQDPHTKQFSAKMQTKNCFECHTSTNFTERKTFDHNKTSFVIDGKHTDLKCEECHKPTEAKFTNKPFNFMSKFHFNGVEEKFCSDCHQTPHTKQFSAKFSSQACITCHTTKTFEQRNTFDHNTTNYALKGKHMTLECNKCHVPTVEKFASGHNMSKFKFVTLGTNDCGACHRDVHKGTFGNKCSECHKETTWKSSNDFHKNFTLSGVHYSLSCTECHKNGRRLAGLSDQCIACHQKDDIHKGTQPNCGSCHRQVFWENTKFNHGLTNFALRGIHRTLDCESCHSNGVFKGTASRCVDCHRSAALSFTGSPNHAVLLGRSCTECHNQFSFR